MSGGFLVARDRSLYRRAVDALVALGGVVATDELGGGVVQFTDDSGRLFSLYERVPDGTDWEVREGPFTAAPGVRPPDMQLVTACPFECRWPDLFARLADVIARTEEAPTWVLDGDGVVWDANAVDPLRCGFDGSSTNPPRVGGDLGHRLHAPVAAQASVATSPDIVHAYAYDSDHHTAPSSNAGGC